MALKAIDPHICPNERLIMNREFLQNQFKDTLIKITLSSPRAKSEAIKKVVIKPFLKGERLLFQFESFTATQAFHHNHDAHEACASLTALIDRNTYRQINGETTTGTWQMLLSKKGKITLKEQPAKAQKAIRLDHNRKKSYLLEEGEPVAFLVALGVMTTEGRVVKRRYDKFKQINRFIEMVADVAHHLPNNRPVKVIDFGCGRSYLTFALYHYLVALKGMTVEMVGLDLKEQVIKDCNALAKQCGYDQLHFEHGDIVDYDKTQDVDMVVTLHACDTATDLALKKANAWGAKVILSVPCCQHELNATIGNDAMADIFQYGIIKERMAALMTDAMRGNWLKLHGYEVHIMEFIDVAHTPKNLLIRAVRVVDVPEADIDYHDFDRLMADFDGHLTLRQEG